MSVQLNVNQQPLGFSDLCYRYGLTTLIDDCQYWDL